MQLQTKTTYNLKQSTPIPLTDKEPKRPDSDVLETKPRRRFTAKYKLSILTDVDACTKPGEIGALLRREGLYYSNIHTWQRQQQEGVLKGLTPKKLKQAETIIEVPKNIGNSAKISARKKLGELMNTVTDPGLQTNTKEACAAFGLPRATYYRQAASRTPPVPAVRPAPHWHAAPWKNNVFWIPCMSPGSATLHLLVCLQLPAILTACV